MDSYVQVVAPNGDYRYGYVKATDEQDQHLTICMHEEGESKLAYEEAADRWDGQAPIGEEHGLSIQELRVLELLSEGLNTRAIAQQLKLQPTTIRSYLRILRLKLRVENRTQLMIVAHAILNSSPPCNEFTRTALAVAAKVRSGTQRGNN